MGRGGKRVVKPDGSMITCKGGQRYIKENGKWVYIPYQKPYYCLLYTSPSPRDDT